MNSSLIASIIFVVNLLVLNTTNRITYFDMTLFFCQEIFDGML